MHFFKFQVTDPVPTFNQFVQYVLSKPYGKWDRHYEIMWRRCNVCQIKYDFVGKLESFDQDVDQVYKYVSQLYQISASLFKQQSILSLLISFDFQFEKCLIQKHFIFYSTKNLSTLTIYSPLFEKMKMKLCLEFW